MKTAVKEHEAGVAGEMPAAEIPALLVAGGSCSRLCRSQRVTNGGEAPQGAGAAPALNSTLSARSGGPD